MEYVLLAVLFFLWLSFFMLLLVVVALASQSKKRQYPSVIALFQFMTLLFTVGSWLLDVVYMHEGDPPETFCAVQGVAISYGVLSSCYWAAIHSYHLNQTLVKEIPASHMRHMLKWYILLAWVFPLFPAASLVQWASFSFRSVWCWVDEPAYMRLVGLYGFSIPTLIVVPYWGTRVIRKLMRRRQWMIDQESSRNSRVLYLDPSPGTEVSVSRSLSRAGDRSSSSKSAALSRAVILRVMGISISYSVAFGLASIARIYEIITDSEPSSTVGPAEIAGTAQGVVFGLVMLSTKDVYSLYTGCCCGAEKEPNRVVSPRRSARGVQLATTGSGDDTNTSVRAGGRAQRAQARQIAASKAGASNNVEHSASLGPSSSQLDPEQLDSVRLKGQQGLQPAQLAPAGHKPSFSSRSMSHPADGGCAHPVQGLGGSGSSIASAGGGAPPQHPAVHRLSNASSGRGSTSVSSLHGLSVSVSHSRSSLSIMTIHHAEQLLEAIRGVATDPQSANNAMRRLQEAELTPEELQQAVNYQNGLDGTTALMLAAQHRLVKLMQSLITARADLDIIDQHGYTALMYAAKKGSVRCTRLLLQAGANTLITTKDGASAVELSQNASVQRMVKRFSSKDRSRRRGVRSSLAT